MYNLGMTLGLNLSESRAALNLSNTDNIALPEALGTTCKLYHANNILANITFDDQTAKDALSAMSAKSIEDACNWVNSELLPFNTSVQCDNSSHISELCGQWSDFVSIKNTESKVDTLKEALPADSITDREIDAMSWVCDPVRFESDESTRQSLERVLGITCSSSL